MQLLKVRVNGLPLFKGAAEIDFISSERMTEISKERYQHLFANVYVSRVISLIGINASGKTAVVNMLSFVMAMMANQPVNIIRSSGIMSEAEQVQIEVWFYSSNEIGKLTTELKRNPDGRLVIKAETLQLKPTSAVSGRNRLFDFEGVKPDRIRNETEEYLLDDVSIIVAYNKTRNDLIHWIDLSSLTNQNILTPETEDYPHELIAFLDPSVEYLRVRKTEQKEQLVLKFYGKEEVMLNTPLQLNEYLSSGTIKGMDVFMSALHTFQNGGYLLIDELENHFNHEIVSTLIRMFMDASVNWNHGTLIFTTHYAELLDEFKRGDSIYITRNQGGITAEKLSASLKREDLKKSQIYASGVLGNTAPKYETYLALRKRILEMPHQPR
ncbi:MAG: ATP-binding protein [Solobacterium sp.]|jgi:predicted ATPase|nr:ATP-binding protein [Solobacterium sp.]MCH4222127.1 ATP-binding protein [Solobacterium sp.]MCH4265886.1 ATP-binding protein [Solobacterium sp.]